MPDPVEIASPDETESAIRAFVARHLLLVERERASDAEQTRVLTAARSPAQLQRLGLALAGLRITRTRTGLGARPVLTCEPAVAGDALPPTSLRVGDAVRVQGAGDATLSGVVSRVTAALVAVALRADDHVPPEWRERCALVRLATDATYARIERALRDLAACAPRPHLHRVLFGAEPARLGAEDIAYVDGALDASQRHAVALAVRARDAALIHGPPGTGKTQTVAEAVRQLCLRGLRVLACAPSNVAVDNLAERLGGLRIVRLGHAARMLPAGAAHSLDYLTRHSDAGALLRDVRAELDACLRRAAACKRAAERRELRAEIAQLRREFRAREAGVVAQTVGGAQVVLATLSGAQARCLAAAPPFDVVVIDEATQAVEGEAWIAALRAPKLIVAGDDHQLPPTVKSQRAPAALSLFDRARARLGPACCMLETQYRMHELIMRVPAARLYDGRLRAAPAVAAHVLADIAGVADDDDTRAALVFVDTADAALLEDVQDASLADRDSRLNRGEAALAAAHVARLLAAGLPPRDIAVVSPYAAQVRLLRSLLAAHLPELEIGSVDGFQGREKEAVVLSLVRSNDRREIGFLADYRRINVAVTRARRHLCVIADSRTVATSDPFLCALVAHLEENAELRCPEEYDV
ncbi:hypothetical protein H4R23_003297 [Coemansia sp. Cherry 401B]|nr:hypothetical protein IWW54_003672 [Coemansia sp. RSA 2705]KAJ2730513.1 hypothetical protein H4R23_003297 [Coemansia sp. Cherry 401B]